MVQIKGRAIRVRIDYVTERFGVAGWERVRAALQPAHAALLEGGVLLSGWYPLSLSNDLLGCAEVQLADGDGRLCREIGAASARRGLEGVHSAFSGATRASQIAAKMERSTSLLWQVHYDSGAMHTRAIGAHAIESELDGIQVDAPWMCHVLSGYLGAHIEVLGGDGVAVEHRYCHSRGDGCCVWHSIWEG